MESARLVLIVGLPYVPDHLGKEEAVNVEDDLEN